MTNFHNYNDIVWGDVEKILHENNISQNNKFNKFKIYVSCKINDDVEIKVYKDQLHLRAVLPLFNGEKLYVHVAGKMIRDHIHENLSSKYDYNCVPDVKIKNLTIKLVSRYGNMTYRYQLQQPRPMIESKLVKQIKYVSHEEQINNYNFLSCKEKLSLL